jgi:hypothetical protein
VTELSPQVRAIVRDVAPLGALVARVLARGPQSVADLAVAVLVPDGQALPQVQTIGPWTEPVSGPERVPEPPGREIRAEFSASASGR